jgi:hypothetical protein
MGAEIDPHVTGFLANTYVFSQPWGLDAVAPGPLDVSVARQAEQVVAPVMEGRQITVSVGHIVGPYCSAIARSGFRGAEAQSHHLACVTVGVVLERNNVQGRNGVR